MFGHLKPEDFLNWMESGEVPAVHRMHLDSCARCRETWDSLPPLHAEMTSLDSEIPQPDWARFRSSVRDELLSRSIKRQSGWQAWTSGWNVRPGLAWALSLLLAVAIPSGAFFWHLQNEKVPSTTVESSQSAPAAADLIESGTEQMVFDDLIDLNDSEQAQLQQMLQAAIQTGTQRLQ
jgi:hypothetical protein